MFESLRNQFLIAMPSLSDPNFSHTVTYICEHNEQGALGIVINQPLAMTYAELFAHLDIEDQCSNGPNQLLLGGPVQPDRGFVLHTFSSSQQWASSLPISDSVCLTTSRDILEAIAKGAGPKQVLIALGYAGWAPGQLASELAANAWPTSDADTVVLFELPFEERAEAAAASLGVDLNLIATEFGNA